MAAEYGATMGFFPVDAETLRYLSQTGRPAALVDLVERYTKAQGMWRADEPTFEAVLEFDLGTVEPSLAGPSRPESLVALADAPRKFRSAFAAQGAAAAEAPPVTSTSRPLQHGDIAIASIASCTNTANPYQMIAAGLLARNAVAKGLRAKPWIKTSFSPGSRVVPAMLAKAGLDRRARCARLSARGFGCMTCGSGSGALAEEIAAEIAERDLVAVGVISSNRNFEGRLSASLRGTFLASPPLVVAYAIAGSILTDLTREKLGDDTAGRPVYLADLWPADADIRACVERALTAICSTAPTTRSPIPDRSGANIPLRPDPLFPWDPEACICAVRRSWTTGGGGRRRMRSARVCC